jgi:hypothetical protein
MDLQKQRDRQKRTELNRKKKMAENPAYAENCKRLQREARARWLKRHPNWLKEYNERNKEKLFKYRQEYRNKNLQKITEYEAGRSVRIKTEVLAAYGGTCVCCGETREPFLTLDHFTADRGVFKIRKGYASIVRGFPEYRRLKRLGWPPVVRVMCMNCNFAIRYGEICPHKLTRQKSKGG